jgi:hypothetical protein
MDVSDAKEEVSATEYLRWVQLFEEEWNDKEPLHYYLAQIAFQVYLCRFMLGGTPDRDLEDFLIPFTLEKRSEEQSKADKDKLKTEVQMHQQMMLANFAVAQSLPVPSSDFANTVTFR